MVDLSAIGVALTSLNTAASMVKAMTDVRDATVNQGKVFELQRAILEAQQSVFGANEERSSLIKLVQELEEKLKKYEAWETEKQRYELKEVSTGQFAYGVKEAARGNEPVHLLCANCFGLSKKSLLQKTVSTDRLDRWKCNACGEQLTNAKIIGGVSIGSRSRSWADRGPQSWMR
jgi:hypothetical protein